MTQKGNYFCEILVFPLLILLCSCVVPSALRAEQAPIPARTSQLVIVLTQSFDDNQARLYCFERQVPLNNWRLRLGPFAAIIGKRGLAWGRGLHSNLPDYAPVKVEGDKKSPAGVFRLGPVIGRPEELPDIKMPYVSIMTLVECVDDPRSRYYNQLVRPDTVAERDWNSSERLFLPGIWYDFGVVVQHNSPLPVSGSGSCIFLHNWDSPSDSTTGCTALAPENLTQIVKWLDILRQPVIVQLPQSIYEKVKQKWHLPAIHDFHREP